ncbi:hypothetical protein [Nitriliruptor alkaliphilus]|uniref:hypothetical protein n=1 Tax=Nitriliruptor alkaliphilus TaxID=427918 RepID=UPI000697ACD1|nr:hypothetical protein [Nitriliruptor alkaliphilus]
MTERPPAAGARAGAWLRRVADVRQPPPGARRWLLLVGAALFLGGAVAAARALDLPPGGVRVAPVVVVAVVLTPLTIAVNAVELIALARLLGQPLPARTAVRVVVLGTAANLLPIPGAAALRIQALAGGGATYGAATAINVAAALTWLGSAAAVAGVALLSLGRGPLGAGVLLVGTGGAVASLLVARRVATVLAPGPALGLLAVTEVATVIVHALRLVLLLGAIGAGASFAAATVVGTSGPLAAAAGVFPAGLGIAEAAAAGAGTLVGVAAAAAFAAAALNRLVGYGVLGIALVVPAVRRPPEHVAGSAPTPPGDPDP